MKTDVAIVGAGPAGLFAAWELAKETNLKVALFDQGKPVAERQRGDSFDLLHGMGGSGTYSDGKLNFHPEIGGNLHNFLPQTKAQGLIDQIEVTFQRYGVQTISTDEAQTHELERRAATCGIKFLPIRQAHIGSDHLVEFVQHFGEDLRQMNVELHFATEVQDITCQHGQVKGLYLRGDELVEADFVILAPGRVGSEWMGELAQKHCLHIHHNPVDIGVRVEVPNIVMEEIVGVCYDPKLYARTPTFDDKVRTFCVAPKGFVVQEVYKEDGEGRVVGVNGHALADRESPNTNLALLVSVSLTEPLEDTTAYGMDIARATTRLGGGKPLLQSLGDLQRQRRSTWPRLRKSTGDVVPTLTEVTPGNITMALPYRILTDILEALEMFDRVIPGLASNRTLLYATEMKAYARRFVTDCDLQTNVVNLFVAGDGAGVSRGIVGAAATGIIAARGIIS